MKKKPEYKREVFCEDCAYYSNNFGVGICHNPSACRKSYRRKCERIHPSKLNSDNRCVYYKERVANSQIKTGTKPNLSSNVKLVLLIGATMLVSFMLCFLMGEWI